MANNPWGTEKYLNNRDFFPRITTLFVVPSSQFHISILHSVVLWYNQNRVVHSWRFLDSHSLWKRRTHLKIKKYSEKRLETTYKQNPKPVYQKKKNFKKRTEQRVRYFPQNQIKSSLDCQKETKKKLQISKKPCLLSVLKICFWDYPGSKTGEIPSLKQ